MGTAWQLGKELSNVEGAKQPMAKTLLGKNPNGESKDS
jgi:hypothetical protein